LWISLSHNFVQFFLLHKLVYVTARFTQKQFIHHLTVFRQHVYDHIKIDYLLVLLYIME